MFGLGRKKVETSSETVEKSRADIYREARTFIEKSPNLEGDKTAFDILNQYEDGADIPVMELLQQRKAKLDSEGAGATADATADKVRENDREMYDNERKMTDIGA